MERSMVQRSPATALGMWGVHLLFKILQSHFQQPCNKVLGIRIKLSLLFRAGLKTMILFLSNQAQLLEVEIPTERIILDSILGQEQS